MAASSDSTVNAIDKAVEQSAGRKVFIVGPGFIGWNVLDLLVAEGYSVTALVRRNEHAHAIEQSGAVPVLGSLDDSALIKECTLDHDIVFHTATADHLPSAQAVCEAISQRAKAGKHTIYIHTSGTSLLNDDANGNTSEFFPASRSDLLRNIPAQQPLLTTTPPSTSCARILTQYALQLLNPNTQPPHKSTTTPLPRRSTRSPLPPPTARSTCPSSRRKKQSVPPRK